MKEIKIKTSLGVYCEKVTIELSAQQLRALEEMISLGSEDASLSHQNGSYDDDDYDAFIKGMEDPALKFLEELKKAYATAQ